MLYYYSKVFCSFSHLVVCVKVALRVATVKSTLTSVNLILVNTMELVLMAWLPFLVIVLVLVSVFSIFQSRLTYVKKKKKTIID